jgi:DNA-binding transcriptional MerR regulator
VAVHFKIGEIAEMFEISVRTLHLYDKMGLFKPEYTDEATGYRYYTADQTGKLQNILDFKKIGFSLHEIKVLYDNGLKPNELLAMLNKKIDHYKQQIDTANYNIEIIKNVIETVEIAAGIINKDTMTEQEKAVRMSRILSLESTKLSNFFSEILWL